MSAMDAPPERMKKAIGNVKASRISEPAGEFFLSPCPFQGCFGLETMLAVLTSKDGTSAILCTEEDKFYYTKSSFYAINLFGDDKFCRGLENNKIVIYQVPGWNLVRTLDEKRAGERWRAAGEHLFYIDRGANVVEVWDQEGTKIQSRLEHDGLEDILAHPRECRLLSWSRNRAVNAWSFENPQRPECQIWPELPDEYVPLIVRGNFVVLRSETRHDCVFRYFDGSPVPWIEEQWPKYASYWTKFCLRFSDGTSVIGTLSDANKKTVRNFAIVGPDGVKRSTFEHEDVCNIAILADDIVITSTTIDVKKRRQSLGNVSIQ